MTDAIVKDASSAGNSKRTLIRLNTKAFRKKKTFQASILCFAHVCFETLEIAQKNAQK